MKNLIKTVTATSVLLTSVGIINQHQMDAATTYKYVDKKTTVNYKVVKQSNASLSLGYTKTLVKGKNGYKVKRYKQTVKNGKVVSTVYYKTMKNVKPVNKVYQAGTKALPSIPKTQYNKDYSDIFYDSKEVSPYAGIKVGTMLDENRKVTEINESLNLSYEAMAKEDANEKYLKAKNEDLSPSIVGVYLDGGYFFTGLSGLSFETLKAFNENKIFDMKVFNDEIIKLINEERKKKGVAPIKYNKHILNGANIRAMEMANTGEFVDGHLRNDGSGRSFNTVFEPEIKPYITSENAYFEGTTRNPYELVSEKFVAESAFTWWKNSPVHYKAMMNPYNKSVATSVKLGSKIRKTYHRDTLYGAMIFANK